MVRAMDPEPIHVYVGGTATDPRSVDAIPGVVAHHGPRLHPDDVVIHQGIPVTSPSRTLIDLAEELDRDELRRCFERARQLGLLQPSVLRAARARVEWRPSLVLVDDVLDEFALPGT